MKRRIFLTIAAMTLAALGALYLISVPIYHSFYQSEAESQLRAVANVAVAEKSDFLEIDTLLRNAVPYPVRITVIDRDGTVLYDNEADPSSMENHADRPEVTEAFQSGSGEDQRTSATVGKRTFYYALLLNGRVIRFARDFSSMSSLFFAPFPITFFLMFLLCVLAITLTSRLSRRIIRPVEEMVSRLDSTKDGQVPNYDDIDIYPELAPLAIRTREMSRSIIRQISELREERDTVNMIMENMQEGLILLGPMHEILTVNQSAKKLLNPQFVLEGNKSIIEFTRNPVILSGLDRLSTESHVVFDMDDGERNERHYRVSIDRVGQSGGRLQGVVMLLMDVTSERQAELVRRDFAANVSHELKTPLTTIKGFGELLATGMLTEPQSIIRHGKTIYREAERLLLLINDIIRLSQIEEGEAELAPTDLLECAKYARESLKTNAEERQVEVRIQGDPLVVNANQNYINELFVNLLDNAIKYNKTGGSVDIGLKKSGQYAEITVADTGIGIPEEHQNRIFERFYRVDKSRSKATGGTGLGLSIVKHIVSYHSGFIRLSSKEGAGTKITIDLPIGL